MSEMQKPDGVSMIAAERARQIAEEGYSAEHDDEHESGDMALAAALYAAPELLFARRDFAAGVTFTDPFPWRYDKRFGCGEAKENPGNVLPCPSTYTDEERTGLLVKAGALIAAEVDRLLRKAERGAAAPEETDE